MVMLKPMSAERFENWWEQVWVSYRAELIQAGATPAAADENVENNVAATFVDGALAPGNFVFDVFADDDRVGVTWLAERGDEWFIYDIEIVESYRGRGLGRETMRAIEQYVREHGGKQIALSVFGFNQTAQRLYLSEGYETVRLSMLKKLT